MPIVLQSAASSGAGGGSTYTFSQVINMCKRYCGREESGWVTEFIKDAINSSLGEIFTDAALDWRVSASSFDTVAEYTTGTATVTQGSPTVTFSGGAVMVSAFEDRKFLRKGGEGQDYTIDTQDTSSQVTLANNYMGDSQSDIEYRIVQDTYSLASNFEHPKVVDQKFSGVRMTIVEHLPVAFKVGSRPRICRITPGNEIRLHPAPDRVINIPYEYYNDQTLISSLTDTLQIPDRYIATLCYGVAQKYWLTVPGDRMSLNKAQQFSILYQQGREDIVADKYRYGGKLVQFVPYDQPGVTNPSGSFLAGFSASELLG